MRSGPPAIGMAWLGCGCKPRVKPSGAGKALVHTYAGCFRPAERGPTRLPRRGERAVGRGPGVRGVLRGRAPRIADRRRVSTAAEAACRRPPQTRSASGIVSTGGGRRRGDPAGESNIRPAPAVVTGSARRCRRYSSFPCSLRRIGGRAAGAATGCGPPDRPRHRPRLAVTPPGDNARVRILVGEGSGRLPCRRRAAGAPPATSRHHARAGPPPGRGPRAHLG